MRTCSLTPLCVPEEVGALGAALCSKQGANGPLALTSVKACYGHTEGTAGANSVCEHFSIYLHTQLFMVLTSSGCPSGMSGIQMALLSLSANASNQHLRVVNAYVTAALGEWLRPAVLPRQHAGGCSTVDSAGVPWSLTCCMLY